MIYRKNIFLSASVLKALIDAGVTATDFLVAELSQSDMLEKLILDYEYGKGKLQNIQILKNSLSFISPLKGKFKVGYEINEYSLCATIDYTGFENMSVDFEIDKETGSILLSGENRIERSDEI